CLQRSTWPHYSF
nr:immunoglobulin light chain junction region [Macaca mulatta]MOW73109.1 immunoglobulin light chain junction region [Macaca mulatta]MOW74725.1 immunoglobulin light chain junction region [Macaca mulatta]